jgi:elongator complex protein 4
MSSFKRRIQSNQPAPVKGAQPLSGSASLLQVSTGILSLDDLLGGGLPLGHVLVILAPDYHSAWGELIARYFIAQGLSSSQRVLVCSDQPSRLVSGCMWHPGTVHNHALDPNEHEEKDESLTNEDNKIKIAWRYEQLKPFKTTVNDSDSRDGEQHYMISH